MIKVSLLFLIVNKTLTIKSKTKINNVTRQKDIKSGKRNNKESTNKKKHSKLSIGNSILGLPKSVGKIKEINDAKKENIATKKNILLA